MCIIVAKPAGALMPDMKIIENCFSNNPDGAGIMLNHNGKVYGFKGFMNLESFKAALSKLQKKYGKLTGKNVVMHFRIGTHGTNIAANTHPFPVVSSYKSMRQLEWESGLGMAHNGIITCVDRHIDIKKENVSDTMVFIKRVVNPISSITNIMKSDKILEGLWLASESKLAFLDGFGNLKVLGDFTFENGVYYSNSSYKYRRAINWSYKPYGTFDDYYTFGKGWKTQALPEAKKEDRVVISADDEAYMRRTLRDEYGLIDLDPTDRIVYEGDIYEEVGNTVTAYDPADMTIYEWDDYDYEWLPFMTFSDYEYIQRGADVLA